MDRKKVLGDHKKIKNKLIAPIGDLVNSEYSYMSSGIPEIIWLSIIITEAGLKQGTDYAYRFAKLITDLKIKEDAPYFISWFLDLREDDAKIIKEELIKIKLYDKINIALIDFLNVYPECPLNKIFDNDLVTENNVNNIREVLGKLYDKRSRESVLALTNAVYLSGACGKLHIVKGTPLDDIEEIKNYPNTEKSKLIASGIRATSNLLLSTRGIGDDLTWQTYFWNRGLELDSTNI